MIRSTGITAFATASLSCKLFIYEAQNATGCPLFKLDNVIITPHSAGFVFDSYKRRSINAFQNIQRVMSGQEPMWIARFT